MKPVFNLANRIYVLEIELEGGRFEYTISCQVDEMSTNSDQAIEYRMNSEVYRLILEEFGACTHYFDEETCKFVSYQDYERKTIGEESGYVFDDSWFLHEKEAKEAAQFLFELFMRDNERVSCVFPSTGFNREIRWKGVKFLLQVNEEGKVDGEVFVTIPSERIYDSTQLEFENKIKMISGAEITYQGHIVDLKVDSLTKSFLLVANLV